MRTGAWVIVFLQLPNCDSRPAGVLLWDPRGNKLLQAFRGLNADEVDDDLGEVWPEFSNWLSSLAEELGGLEALEYLESGASHVVQISARTEAEISSSDVLLNSLFKAKVLGGALFTPNELNKAKMRLPLLPSSTIQILSAMNNPLADTRQIERAISNDPLITAHLIRLANSAALQVREPARSLESAIRRVGIESTRLHVIALSIGKMYSSPPLRKLWDHSLATAQVARQLADVARMSTAEASLLALVHDIGLLVMFSLGESFESAYLELQVSGLTGLTAEEKLCNVNHAEVGADLLADWNFPSDMCEAVRYHHSPSLAMSSFASLLYIAESWQEKNEDVYLLSEHVGALQRLGLQQMSVGVIRETLDSDLQVLRAVR